MIRQVKFVLFKNAISKKLLCCFLQQNRLNFEILLPVACFVKNLKIRKTLY